MKSLLFNNISKKVNIFPSDFNTFFNFLKGRKISKNDFLLNEGDIANSLAFVVSGVLYSYSIDEKGEKHVIQIAVKNHWISDPYSFLSQEKAIYNVQAIETSEVLLLSKSNFEKACQEIPIFERFFRLLIQNAYIQSMQRISQIYAQTAEERYVKLQKNHPEILDSVPQHYIASFLGIKPQSLSRIRKKLANENK